MTSPLLLSPDFDNSQGPPTLRPVSVPSSPSPEDIAVHNIDNDESSVVHFPDDEFSVYDELDYDGEQRQSDHASVRHSLLSASSPASEHYKRERGTPQKQRSPFRNPSSVRAMQMSTTPPMRYSPLSDRMRAASGMTAESQRSKTSPKKNKEFPLILLHATLLPINLPYPDSLLLEMLPEDIWENLTTLRAKINCTTLDRGVLIPHPRDDYSLLEERLLESLDLRTPRILKCGHFHHPPSPSTSSEDGSAPSSPSCQAKENGKTCLDCNRHIKLTQPLATGSKHTKWEIRVFASNGLMRAGAWVAAWKDMERVDVEILPWISDELKQELETRRAEIEALEAEMHSHMQSESTNHPPDPFHDFHESKQTEHAQPSQDPPVEPTTGPAFPFNLQGKTFAESLRIVLSEARTFFARHDPKTLAIAVLSLLVLFMALSSGRSSTPLTKAINPISASSASVSSTAYSCAAPSSDVSSVTQVTSSVTYTETPGLTEADLEGFTHLDDILLDEL